MHDQAYFKESEIDFGDSGKMPVVCYKGSPDEEDELLKFQYNQGTNEEAIMHSHPASSAQQHPYTPHQSAKAPTDPAPESPSQ